MSRTLAWTAATVDDGGVAMWRRKQETTMTEDDKISAADTIVAARTDQPERKPEPTPPSAADTVVQERRWAAEGIPGGRAAVPRVLVSQRRETCDHCRGTGYVPNVSDYLRESIGLLGDQGDEVVHSFYGTLFRADPDLVSLFPGNPTEGDFGTDHKGARQRESLLKALTALANLYDPDSADKMAQLDTALKSFGRSHAAFARKDGTIRGATWEEYGAVKAALFATLVRAAGNAWRAEFTESWSQAYDYAAAVMLAEQHRSGFSAPRFPRA
jgi:hemoglobin-like flavoprotein